MTYISLKKNLSRYFVIVIAVFACPKKGDGQIAYTDGPDYNFSTRHLASEFIANQPVLADQMLTCFDIFEPNDSRSLAQEIEPTQVYQGLISTPLDVDWFKFTLTALQPNVRVRLFDLPTDYNIFLYNPGKDKIGTSKNKNAVPDTIIVNGLTSGTYYIKIRGKAGKSDPNNCYSLKVETSAFPFRESSFGGLMVADSRFELYPNPVTDQLIVQCNEEVSSVIFSIYNLMGQKISELNPTLDEMLKATLDVKGLVAGEYFLQIRYDKGTEVKKFVVSQ